MQSLISWVLLAMTTAWLQIGPIVGTAPKDVADAIAAASFEKPLFDGADGARQTAALLTAIAVHESGFRKDAKGDCRDLPPGSRDCGKLGTTPTSFGLFQIHLEPGQKTAEGWTADDLLADSLKQARSARELVRASIRLSPVDWPLLRYAGTKHAASLRFQLAKKLFSSVPYTVQCD